MDRLKSFFLYFFIFIFTIRKMATENHLVRPPCGPIIGSTMTTLSGRKFLAFRGVPYGEPPTGELRFKNPVAKASWTDKALNAIQEGPECFQYDLTTKSFKGQEDCLRLNVYTPDVSGELKPVLLFIHGGGFTYGSNSAFIYGPRRLLDHDIVLVTINYRLHAFGFLSTENDASPGNYGLLDQLEALKWVQRNIKEFGGNANKVTIMGWSAGSASVIYQILSPLSKGLFHQAIAMSGTALNPRSFHESPMYWTRNVAAEVGCNERESDKLVECLRTISPKKLTEAGLKYKKDTLSPFVPVKDGYFLPDKPSTLFARKEIPNIVPLMFGATRNESFYFYAMYIGANLPKFSQEFLQMLVRFTRNLPKDQLSQKAVDLMKKEYIDKIETSDEKSLKELILKLWSYFPFLASHYETRTALVNAGFQPFFYSLDYITEHSIVKKFGLSDLKGVSHGDEIFFLFDSEAFFPFDFQTVNDETEKRFLKMWINFVNYGNPTPESDDEIPNWEASQPKNIKVYHLDKSIRTDEFIDENNPELKFWKTFSQLFAKRNHEEL